MHRPASCLTDNGSPYRSAIHAIACRALGIRHLRTRPTAPADQRQGRTLHPHHARRLGLRRDLPHQPQNAPQPLTAGSALQPSPPTRSHRPTTTRHPPEQPARARARSAADRSAVTVSGRRRSPDRSTHCRLPSAASGVTSCTGVRGEVEALQLREPGERGDVLDDVRALELELEQAGQPGERRDVDDRRLGEHQLLERAQPRSGSRSATAVRATSSSAQAGSRRRPGRSPACPAATARQPGAPASGERSCTRVSSIRSTSTPSPRRARSSSIGVPLRSIAARRGPRRAREGARSTDRRVARRRARRAATSPAAARASPDPRPATSSSASSERPLSGDRSLHR